MSYLITKTYNTIGWQDEIIEIGVNNNFTFSVSAPDNSEWTVYSRIHPDAELVKAHESLISAKGDLGAFSVDIAGSVQRLKFNIASLGTGKPFIVNIVLR